MAKSNKLEFSCFEDIFNHRDATVKAKAPAKNELYAVLHKQRMIIDESAIHIIAPRRECGKKADARNSIFKMSQKYKVLPDNEHVGNLKRLFVDLAPEDFSSGDEEWGPSEKKPELKQNYHGSNSITSEELKIHLIAEMEQIEKESSEMLANGAVSEEIIPEDQIKDSNIGLDYDEDEEDFNPDELKKLNTMQVEFMGTNLHVWFKEMQCVYKNGVKLVKINAMGKKFIRVVSANSGDLYINQPHNMSKVKVDRQVSILDIQSAKVGTDSKEFLALKKLAENQKGQNLIMPNATLCAYLVLPKGRSLSLVFMDEGNRNGFVFFIRVLMKKAHSD